MADYQSPFDISIADRVAHAMGEKKTAPPAGKYPTGVGKNYFGEFAGFAYNPYDDSYHPIANDKNSYLYKSGIAKRPPGVGEQLGLMAAGAGVNALGRTTMDTLTNYAKGHGDGMMNWVSGLFGDNAEAPSPLGSIRDAAYNYIPTYGSTENPLAAGIGEPLSNQASALDYNALTSPANSAGSSAAASAGSSSWLDDLGNYFASLWG